MLRQAGSVLSGHEGQLWSAYQSDRSLDNRNALVEFYLPLLGWLASRMAHRLVKVSAADLTSDASGALIRAVETFDPTRGLRFVTFAAVRLHGAMIDAVRDRDPVPRAARAHANRIATIERKWQHEHAKPISDAHLARRLGVSREGLAAWRQDIALTRVVEISMEGVYAYKKTGEVVHFADVIEDRALPVAHAHQSCRDWWRDLTLGLSPMQRAAVILYWRYGWTMKRIAMHMGLAESRISQAHSAAVRFLKVARRMDDFADISSRGTSPKLLRLALPICHAIRRQHHQTRPRKRAAA